MERPCVAIDKLKLWINLPSPRTVRKRIQWFQCWPGINEELLSVIEKKVESLDENARQIKDSLVDEGHLKKRPSYDNHLKHLFPEHSKAQVCMAPSTSNGQGQATGADILNWSPNRLGWALVVWGLATLATTATAAPLQRWNVEHCLTLLRGLATEQVKLCSEWLTK